MRRLTRTYNVRLWQTTIVAFGGMRLNKCNYRPVSILTTISKIYESILNDQLCDYFKSIFDVFLSAYRKGYSCQSVLIKFIEDWKDALDNGKIVGALFMDLSKAFDCMPHGLLVAKLSAYGVSLNSCMLIASYLTDRIQRVKISSARSSWASLEKGVPQGSILGPLLFNIFMNDLFWFIEKCKLYNYADDNSLSNTANDVQIVVRNLEIDTSISITWFHSNGMEANPAKFQFMLSSTKALPQQSIRVDKDTTIESEDYVKLLGITIDNKLNFSKHVSDCCIKASRQLNALRRIAHFLDKNTKRIILQCFVYSNLNYCPIVWHFCGRQNFSKIEKIHKRALQIICGDYDLSYTDLCDNLNTSPLLVSRLKLILIEVFKSLKNINPEFINDMFHHKCITYSLRDPDKLVSFKPNSSTFGVRSFTYIGCKLWNELPNSIKPNLEEDVEYFKENLSKWNGPRDLTYFMYV